MSKMYVKDSNGKYRLVERNEDKNQSTLQIEKENPEAQKWVTEVMQGPKIRDLEDRIKRIEWCLFDPRK